jgi:hypothetical protein
LPQVVFNWRFHTNRSLSATVSVLPLPVAQGTLNCC